MRSSPIAPTSHQAEPKLQLGKRWRGSDPDLIRQRGLPCWIWGRGGGDATVLALKIFPRILGSSPKKPHISESKTVLERR